MKCLFSFENFKNMRPKYLSILIIAGTFLPLIGCFNTSSEPAEDEGVDDNAPIILTEEQKEIAGIELGVLEKRLVADIVECTGIIDVPPTNLGSVYAQIGGVINKINVVPGTRVSKGDVLATISHQEIIKLQENFLDSRSRFLYWEEEYKRKKALEESEALSRKVFLDAQAEYSAAKIRYESLREQLSLIGIYENELLNRGISSKIMIRSPLSGYVSAVYTNIGMYVGINTQLFEILDNSHVHLELNVFSNDINKIRNGQRVRFQDSGSEEIHWAEIRLIGKKIEEENRSVLVHAFITDTFSEVPIGASVLAQILTQPDSAYCLPEEAILIQGTESFIFIMENDSFIKRQIVTGRTFENHTEVYNPEYFLGKQIIVRGAYYLEE